MINFKDVWDKYILYLPEEFKNEYKEVATNLDAIMRPLVLALVDVLNKELEEKE